MPLCGSDGCICASHKVAACHRYPHMAECPLYTVAGRLPNRKKVEYHGVKVLSISATDTLVLSVYVCCARVNVSAFMNLRICACASVHFCIRYICMSIYCNVLRGTLSQERYIPSQWLALPSCPTEGNMNWLLVEIGEQAGREKQGGTVLI